jgi:hypothetical protein
MSNYLLELENEIILKWSGTYDKLRKSHSEHIITSFGICVRSSPCWYIFAEYDHTIIAINLYVVEDKVEFNQVVWLLTSTAPPDREGIKHIQKYWVKPDEVRSGYETIHFEPGDIPDQEGVLIMTVKQVVSHIALCYNLC